MAKQTLKPCPFPGCGSTDVDSSYPRSRAYKGHHKALAGCNQCKATVRAVTEEEAIAEWNRRAEIAERYKQIVDKARALVASCGSIAMSPVPVRTFKPEKLAALESALKESNNDH